MATKKAPATPAPVTAPSPAPAPAPTIEEIAARNEQLSVLLTNKAQELKDLNTKFGKAVELLKEHSTKICNIEEDMDAVKAKAQAAKKAAVETAATSAKPIAGLQDTLERLAEMGTKVEELTEAVDTIKAWMQTAEDDISALQNATGVYGTRESLLTRARKKLSSWIAPK